MATMSQPHSTRHEHVIDLDRFPSFKARFSHDEQQALIDEDLTAAKTVMTVLFAIVTMGLVLGGGTVLLLNMLR
jgi:hypothetical protein